MSSKLPPALIGITWDQPKREGTCQQLASGASGDFQCGHDEWKSKVTALTMSVPSYNPPAAPHCPQDKRPNFSAQHPRLMETGSKFCFRPQHLSHGPARILQPPGIPADPKCTVSMAVLPLDIHPAGLIPAHPPWRGGGLSESSPGNTSSRCSPAPRFLVPLRGICLPYQL